MPYDRFATGTANSIVGTTTTTAGTTASTSYAPLPHVDSPAKHSTVAWPDANRDFILWLNGAVDLLDSTPPSQAQWDTIREKTAEHVAAIVHRRIREMAAPDPVVVDDRWPQVYGAMKLSSTAQAKQSAELAKIQAEIAAHKANNDAKVAKLKSIP